jgi:hypothetical protein
LGLLRVHEHGEPPAGDVEDRDVDARLRRQLVIHEDYTGGHTGGESQPAHHLAVLVVLGLAASRQRARAERVLALA